MFETVCGYIGTAGLICILLPQLHHIYKTKDASGTAWGFISLNYVVSVNYIIYGASLSAYPIVLSNACNLLVVICITYFKISYAKKIAQIDNEPGNTIHQLPV
jgi:MtN3 and saliva related transmembrane protein